MRTIDGFARIEETQLVEHHLDAVEQLAAVLVHLLAQQLLLEQSDFVFSGEGTAEPSRCLDTSVAAAQLCGGVSVPGERGRLGCKLPSPACAMVATVAPWAVDMSPSSAVVALRVRPGTRDGDGR